MTLFKRETGTLFDELVLNVKWSNMKQDKQRATNDQEPAVITLLKLHSKSDRWGERTKEGT